jgi:AbrB family looped-hinge helix DNA binding protein
MSTKGQVVIPGDVRRAMNLRAGDSFVVVGRDDTIVLKTVRMPSLDQVDGLLKEIRAKARAAGLRPAHVRAAIRRARTRA